MAAILAEGANIRRRTHFEVFAALRDSVTNMRAAALERKVQIRQFAQIAQNNALRVSDFVRKGFARVNRTGNDWTHRHGTARLTADYS